MYICTHWKIQSYFKNTYVKIDMPYLDKPKWCWWIWNYTLELCMKYDVTEEKTFSYTANSTHTWESTLREKLVQNLQVIIFYVVMPKPSINNKLKDSLPARTWVQALKSVVFLLQKLTTILMPALCREVHALHWLKC